MRSRSHIPRILFSRTLFIVLIGVMLVFSVSLLREVNRKQEIKNEIVMLEDELVSMETENTRLEHLIEYLKTDEYAELEAKKRLGLKKEGENVILVTEAEAAVVSTTRVDERDSSNWSLWWKYFFNK
ncbi:MAG: FtsB family cell division protein [Patescibacteria group bacterium]